MGTPADPHWNDAAAWGAEPGGDAPVAPLFALPNVFLFPGCIMPMHVFEPRYRQMVEDLLDGPGRMVLGTVLGEHVEVLSGAPPVHAIGGLGEIGRHERLADGRFLIWLVGLKRVAVREAPSDRLYRKVYYAPVCEVEVDGDRARSLRKRLQRAVLQRYVDLPELPADIPIACLTDLLLQRLQLPPSVLSGLYSEPVIAQRAEEALAQHRRRPLPPKADAS